MIVTLNEVLKDAQKEHYAVPLFNTINMEMARGVLKAAEELRSPVIIGTAEVLLKFTPIEELAWFLKPLAERSSVPVVLHLDHGLTPEAIFRAMKLGFSSVMYDCSTLPFEENARRVAEITRAAHGLGVSVEGELGHVGANAAPDDAADLYTRPEEARAYVEETGVDALAVAIGSAHGLYKKKPKLDFERLKEIRAAVDTPLVLHGGSGLTEEDFRTSIREGISKVNIFTDINIAEAKSVADQYALNRGISVMIPGMVDAVAEAAREKIRMFGSAGRA